MFDPTLPLARAHTIPASWYTSSELAQKERTHVFGANWVVAGRMDQVASPGSFLTADIAGEPIVVIRDAQGVLRAFFNVCRHRAAILLTDPCGTATRLRCRYHGWTYDLSGQLRGVPEFDGVEDFCREANGLVPVQVAEWGPLVFVHLGSTAGTGFQPVHDGRLETCPTLSDFLKPLPAHSADIAHLKFAVRREYEMTCNWKVFVDNYLDGGYHINTVHPGLAGVLDYSEYRTECFAWTSLQSSPMKPADAGSEAVGAVRGGERAMYWWVFPNLMLNIYRDVMDTNLVLPLGPDRCKVIFDFYFAESLAPEFIERSIAVAHEIQLEDQTISEEVQRGLGSRSYNTGRFSVKREVAGYHFHRLLAKAIS